MENKIIDIEQQIDSFQEKIIFKLINNELVKLAKIYNNLLERKNMKKSVLPSEDILMFLDTIYELLDDNGFLIEDKFNLYKIDSDIETKKKAKKLRNVSHEWKNLYLRLQFLINLYKNNHIQKILISTILKDIDESDYDKIVIPKELIKHKNNCLFTNY